MSDLQIINDESDLRKYRIELPNIIDDLGLTPYESRLYLHYKRVCGANGGICTEGTRRTAKRTKMGLGQVPKARDGLAERGLIEKIEAGQYVHVKIVDIWELNFAYFMIKDRPDVLGWTIKQLRSYLKSVRHTNTLSDNRSLHERPESNRSPDEQSVRITNTSTQKRSHSETKKEPINKNQPKEVSAAEQRRPPVSLAYKVFVEETKKSCLNLPQIKAINETVGTDPASLEKWRESVKAWNLAGNKLTNAAGMLEWFTTGKRSNYDPNRFNGSGAPDPTPHKPVALDDAKRAAYAALQAEHEAAKKEARQRADELIGGGIKAAGIDIDKEVRKARRQSAVQ